MLILTRRVGETLIICDSDNNVIAEVTPLGVKGNQVRIGIDAPSNVGVHRDEIYQKILREHLEKEVGPKVDAMNKEVNYASA